MDDIQLRDILRDEFIRYAKSSLYIRTKAGKIELFKLNKAQEYIHQRLEKQKADTGKVRALILKGRQQGCSTYTAARYYHRATHSIGVRVFILTHDGEATANLFNIANRYHENVPAFVRTTTGTSNIKELSFSELDSGYKVGTAGNKNVGRSSTIQLFHGCLSEDSLIVLADGSAKRMGDAVEGDVVITSSGAAAPIKYKIYTGDKQTYTLKCWVSGEAIHLTGNHQVLTQDGYKQLSDMTKDDYVAMPDMTPDGSVRVYDYRLKNKERPQGGGSKHIEDYTFKLNYDFGYLLGYYLAEGHAKDTMGYTTFAYHQDETYINEALKGTFGLETSIKHCKEKRTLRGVTHVYGKFLTSAINSICGRVEGKHIPEWFFKTNKDFLAGVFKGYLDGDGSKTDPSKVSAPSVHEKIARQIQRVSFVLYGACSVSRRKRTRYDKPTKDIYLMRISGNTLRRYKNEPLGKRKEKSYVKDGVVYCKVKSIEPRKIESVWDIEVDHEDHNYQTTTGIVSNSEVAFWDNAQDIASGALQAVPDADNTEIILESTANGVGGLYYNMCMDALRGDSKYQLIFTPWFWQDEYRKAVAKDFVLSAEEQEYKRAYDLDDEQIHWRRVKIQELDSTWLFKQEYPATAIEAFQSSGDDCFIDSERVYRARHGTPIIDKDAPLIIGVDPARFGDDRTAIMFREGRVCSKILTYKNKDTMDVRDIVAELIDRYKPLMVNIDVGGLGAGVYDGLKRFGYDDIIRDVNFGGKARNDEKYKNKRAEMWGEMRDWLGDEPNQIPDDDALQADLITPSYKFDNNQRLQLESKDDIKKRGMKSPDLGDALALTFAFKIREPMRIKERMQRQAQQNRDTIFY